MGIFELAQSGSDLRRQIVTIASSPPTGVTAGFGTSYIILNATAIGPCRIRLYSDSASVGIDAARPTSSFDVSASVGLLLDTYFSSSTSQITFDPPVIGTTFSANETWYNIETGTAQNVQFTAFPIEFTEYPTRTALTFMGASIPTSSSGVQGNLTSPNGFLILSASSDAVSRLRLYSRPIEEVPVAETVRAFTSSPITGSSLIADIMFDSAGSFKLKPILEAYNLEQYAQGNNQVGYRLQNMSTTPTVNITASVYIYPIET